MKYITDKIKITERRLKRKGLNLMLMMNCKVKPRKCAITEPKDQTGNYEKTMETQRTNPENPMRSPRNR